MLMYLTLIDTEEEQSKFEKLYHRYKKMMIRAAYDILGEVSLAEDATHEAFIRIADNMHKVGEVESARTRNFMFTIVRNVAKTIRANERKRVEMYEKLEEPANEDVELEVLRKLSLENVVRILDELPDIYKEIVILYWLEDYSVAEVAKFLNVSPNTIKKRISRGRKIISEKLMERGGDCRER